jgi:hypothetical protein
MSVDEGQDEDVEGSRNEEDPDQKEHLGLPPAPTADGIQDLPGVNVVKLFFFLTGDYRSKLVHFESQKNVFCLKSP